MNKYKVVIIHWEGPCLHNKTWEHSLNRFCMLGDPHKWFVATCFSIAALDIQRVCFLTFLRASPENFFLICEKTWRGFLAYFHKNTVWNILSWHVNAYSFKKYLPRTVVGVRDTEKETIKYSPEGTYSDLCAVITNLYQSPTKKAFVAIVQFGSWITTHQTF